MSSETGAWISQVSDGCVLRVWAVPGSSRAGLTGLHGDALRVRVTAPPEGGAANREIVRLLAALLGVRQGDVTLAGGSSGRRKRVHVRGLGADAVRARLDRERSVDTSADRH
jgi:uncharacterized protein